MSIIYENSASRILQNLAKLNRTFLSEDVNVHNIS